MFATPFFQGHPIIVYLRNNTQVLCSVGLDYLSTILISEPHFLEPKRFAWNNRVYRLGNDQQW